MWAEIFNILLTTLRYLAPATLLTLFCGQQGLLLRLLRHIDSAVTSIIYSSDSQRDSVLRWLSTAGGSRVEGLETVWRHGWLVCGAVDAALPGACAGHPRARLTLQHAQSLADQYLGVEPVFSSQELESTDILSKRQEWKLAQYLDRIRLALARISPPVSKSNSPRSLPDSSSFTLDYFARGTGLDIAQTNKRMIFNIYPTVQQDLEPGEITVLIRGPNDIHGTVTIPPILGRAQLVRQAMLGLEPKAHYTENVLPITYGTTYYRSYGKNDMNKTYFIPKTKRDIPIEVDIRRDKAKIAYTVTVPGKYEIFITSRGSNAMGSPYIVIASNEKVDQNESPELRNDADIDIHEDKKVLFRIVDFVSEKMLLKEDGILERISNAEAEKLISKNDLVLETRKEESNNDDFDHEIITEKDSFNTVEYLTIITVKKPYTEYFQKISKKLIRLIKICHAFKDEGNKYKKHLLTSTDMQNKYSPDIIISNRPESYKIMEDDNRRDKDSHYNVEDEQQELVNKKNIEISKQGDIACSIATEFTNQHKSPFQETEKDSKKQNVENPTTTENNKERYMKNCMYMEHIKQGGGNDSLLMDTINLYQDPGNFTASTTKLDAKNEYSIKTSEQQGITGNNLGINGKPHQKDNLFSYENSEDQKINNCNLNAPSQQEDINMHSLIGCRKQKNTDSFNNSIETIKIHDREIHTILEEQSEEFEILTKYKKRSLPSEVRQLNYSNNETSDVNDFAFERVLQNNEVVSDSSTPTTLACDRTIGSPDLDWKIQTWSMNPFLETNCDSLVCNMKQNPFKQSLQKQAAQLHLDGTNTHTEAKIPIKIIIEEETLVTPVEVPSNPFIDELIVERPKTPILKIITGQLQERIDSPYVDPRLAEIDDEEDMRRSNEFLNPFFVHNSLHENTETPTVTDFMIGAPVSLPPLLKVPSPEPDMDSIILSSNLNGALEKYDYKVQNLKSEKTDRIDSSVFSTPLHSVHSNNNSNLSDIIHDKEITFQSADSIDLEYSLDSTIYSNEHSEISNCKADHHRIECTNPNVKVPKKDIWDSAYVSIDENNSSPESNSSLTETPCKKSVSPFQEEFSLMGPAERELWLTCVELEDELNEKILSPSDSPKTSKLEKPTSFTPIEEENDRSLPSLGNSSEIKDPSLIKETSQIQQPAQNINNKTEEYPINVAFTEINETCKEENDIKLPPQGESTIPKETSSLGQTFEILEPDQTINGKTKKDPVTEAFAELNDVFTEYYPNSEASSITTITEKPNLNSMEINYTIQDVHVDSPSEAKTDEMRHEVTTEVEPISEVQQFATESLSVSRALKDNFDELSNRGHMSIKKETIFGDTNKNLVFKRKQFWDEKIKKLEELKTQQQKKAKKPALKSLKHNDSLTRRKGKTIVKNFLQAKDVSTANEATSFTKQNKLNISTEQNTENDNHVTIAEDENRAEEPRKIKLVNKWKQYWDEKLEYVKDELPTRKLPGVSPKWEVPTTNYYLDTNRKKTLMHQDSVKEDTSNKDNLIDIASIADQREISPKTYFSEEEVFKAFETSPKRFFGTSRKNILSKIESFMEKKCEGTSYNEEFCGSKSSNGFVCKRISMFNSVDEFSDPTEQINSVKLNKTVLKKWNSTAELPLTKLNDCHKANKSILRKWNSKLELEQCKSMEELPHVLGSKLHTIDQKATSTEVTKKDIIKSDISDNDIQTIEFPKIKNLVKEMSDKAGIELLPKQKLKELQANNREVRFLYKSPQDIDPVRNTDPKPVSIKENLTKITNVKSAIDTKSNILSLMNEISSISIRDENSVTRPSKLKHLKTSKSEMDIYHKCTTEQNSDLNKSCTDIPKINIKNFISLFESCQPDNEENHKEPNLKRQTTSLGYNKICLQRQSNVQSSDIKSEADRTLPIIDEKVIQPNMNINIAKKANEGDRKCKSEDRDFKYDKPDEIETEKTACKQSFKNAKQFFQSLDELTTKPTKKPRKLNECEIILYNQSSESLQSNENENAEKIQRISPNDLKSHSAPTSDTEYDIINEKWDPGAGASGRRLIKISEKFDVEDLFTDVVEGKLSRSGSFRGIPRKEAVLATFRSMENVSSEKQMTSYEIALTQLNDFAKENKIKNAQIHLSEYPYLPRTDPTKYRSRRDVTASGLISRKELLKTKRRRNSVPDALRLNERFTATL